MSLRSRHSVACIMLLFALSCGGGEEKAAISADKPYAALPSGAIMLFSISPQRIHENPLARRLQQALGKQDEPLVFTGIAAEVGIDPTNELERMDWGLYSLTPDGQANWGLIAMGPFEEQTVLNSLQKSPMPGIKAQVEEKKYLNQPYHVLTRTSGPARSVTYIRFPQPNTLVAASNEAIMQKHIVVTRGRAEGMDADAQLSPLLKEADTAAPAWFVGLAAGTLDRLSLQVRFSRGESLGRGIRSFDGAMNLAEQQIDFRANLLADNPESAQRQVSNFDAAKMAQIQPYIAVLGQAAVEFSNQVTTAPEGSTVVIDAQLTAEEVETLAAQIEQGLSSQAQMTDNLRQQLQGSMPQTTQTQPVEEEN